MRLVGKMSRFAPFLGFAKPLASIFLPFSLLIYLFIWRKRKTAVSLQLEKFGMLAHQCQQSFLYPS